MRKAPILLVVSGILFSLVTGCTTTPPPSGEKTTSFPPAQTISVAPPTTASPSSPPPAATTIAAPPPTTAKVITPNPISATTFLSLAFNNSGHTDYADWKAEADLAPAVWQPGIPLAVHTTLTISDAHIANVAAAGVKVDGFCLLVTAERTFDADGWIRLGSDERMSTLVTPTGLGIEGGVQGAITNRFGAYDFRTPVDEFTTQSIVNASHSGGAYRASFTFDTYLPSDLPPGIYRIRLDYGFTSGKRYYSLNAEAFAYRPFFKTVPTESHMYSPPVRAGGTYVTGVKIDASTIQPRLPWILLGNYNSNGYYGVVADEDQKRFTLSNRNLIPDDVILPLYAGDNRTKLTYSLEPQFPTDTIELRSNIPWNYSSGELSIQVTGPDGVTTDLGKYPFIGKTGQWPTTSRSAFTAWKPSAYGQYTVKAKGWIEDIWGNRYEGGGTYHFWIAKRMTLATATFQGQPYPVGGRYGRDIGFAPAVPADVQVTATEFINSDPNNTKTVKYSGKASPGGIFGAAQGMAPLVFDQPGEYLAHVTAQYTDQEGHLWVCSMRHAGVVYPEDSPIVAHGKKLTVPGGKLVDRGDTYFEGWVESPDINHLAHINYPYQAGDVLLIASEHQGANKIESVLTYEVKAKPAPYDPTLQNIGITNIKIKTGNRYSPHMFPEYTTDLTYFYAGAPRPGFMSRFLVAENGTRAPYWPTSPNSFGGQINASSNGDLPGDIYRLIGGVVVRNQGAAPMYAGYMASAFILPKGSNDNRIIAAGSEDLLGSDQTRARLFLVGTRPGMVYETGTSFTPAVQVDPMLPAIITFTLNYPDGRQFTTVGAADKFGTFAGKDRWLLDIPGVYSFRLTADWQGFQGHMPGLPETGGELYVVEKGQTTFPSGLQLNLAETSYFSASGTLTITGSSTAKSVEYAAVTPGAVIAQGFVPVVAGKFSYTFDPAAISKAFPTYDIVNLVNGVPEIRDVVQLTFSSTERTATGTIYHTFARVLMRGTTVIYAH